MGLDIYVGSFTRYYAGDWETIVQKAAREQGLPVEVMRVNEPPDAIHDPNEIRAIVDGWRDALGTSLRPHLQEEMDWDESPDAPYFTDKPAWDGYGSLILLAAYQENSHLSRPATAVEDWTEDPAWKSVTGEGFEPSYPHLYFPETWLPIHFSFTFRTKDPAGQDVTIGSAPALLDQLRDLNDKTFHGVSADLERWRYEGAEPGGPFDVAARFGMAVLTDLAEKATVHRLPMKLDY